MTRKRNKTFVHPPEPPPSPLHRKDAAPHTPAQENELRYRIARRFAAMRCKNPRECRRHPFCRRRGLCLWMNAIDEELSKLLEGNTLADPPWIDAAGKARRGHSTPAPAASRPGPVSPHR